MNSLAKTILSLLLLPSLAALLPQSAAAQTTYIAVGDSLAYGYQDSTLTPLGAAAYPGYTQAVTQYLTTQTGSTVTFIGLGIVGETTGTLVGNPNDSASNPGFNSYYTSAQTQLSALQSALAAHPNSLVTIQVGANDFLQLLNNVNFQSDVLTNNTAAENALITSTVSTVVNNYAPLLSAVKADSQARVLIVGDYNPYAHLLQDNPSHASDPTYQFLANVAPTLVQTLNSTLSTTAQNAGYQYVDVNSAFASYSGTDALVLDTESPPNIHPTNTGYALIAGQVDRALTAAPEPPGALVFGLGTFSLAGRLLRRRRRTLSTDRAKYAIGPARPESPAG